MKELFHFRFDYVGTALQYSRSTSSCLIARGIAQMTLGMDLLMGAPCLMRQGEH